MVLTDVLLIVIVLYGIINQAYSQDACVPDAIQILTIHANATLTWQVNPDETCEITEFQVDIEGDREDEYHFKVTEPYADVSFLEICEEWRFSVAVISHGVIGYPQTLTEYVPLPPTADLSLSSFTATQLGGRDVLLEWDLMNHTHGDCSLHYRLSVEDEELGIIQDVYVQGTALHLSFLSPCVPYQLGIRAVNRAQPTIEGPLRMTEVEIDPKPQIAPSLQVVDIQATRIDLTFTPEGGSNRCPLRTLYIDGGNFFNMSVSVEGSLIPEPIPVELKSLRPNSMYFMRVYVENSGGLSRATQIGIQTLELSPN